MTLMRARTVFKVPTTHHTLTLFDPTYPKSHFDLLNLVLLGAQVLLFLIWPRAVSRHVFVWSFALWRAAYNAGLGWVLTRQSRCKWIVREVQKRGWLDPDRRPRVRAWIRRQLWAATTTLVCEKWRQSGSNFGESLGRLEEHLAQNLRRFWSLTYCTYTHFLPISRRRLLFRQRPHVIHTCNNCQCLYPELPSNPKEKTTIAT